MFADGGMNLMGGASVAQTKLAVRHCIHAATTFNDVCDNIVMKAS